MASRLNSLLEKLKTGSLDGLLVSKEANVSYLCRQPTRDSYLLASGNKAYFITDFRYASHARKNIKGADVFQYKSLFRDIASLAGRLKIRRLGFEARDLNFAEYSRIKDCAGPKIKLIDTFNLIESARQIKSPQEVEDIRKAISITASAFRFLRGFLRPGRSELEVVGELERFIRLQGAERCAFEIIAASGPNSSYPHAPVSTRIIRPGEPLLIDIGVEVNGYKSDLTRVFFLDKITQAQRKIYKIVQEAQRLAIEAVRPGRQISDIDRAARAHIARSGYGRYFGHSLGHGAGLEVHEDPSISAKNKSPLKEGMVFTIEPGIYLPGKFGIRLEDMVLVTKKGVEVLSGAIDKSI
jgi:Xaa-Pro aminopeptidase